MGPGRLYPLRPGPVTLQRVVPTLPRESLRIVDPEATSDPGVHLTRKTFPTETRCVGNITHAMQKHRCALSSLMSTDMQNDLCWDRLLDVIHIRFPQEVTHVGSSQVHSSHRNPWRDRCRKLTRVCSSITRTFSGT